MGNVADRWRERKLKRRKTDAVALRKRFRHPRFDWLKVLPLSVIPAVIAVFLGVWSSTSGYHWEARRQQLSQAVVDAVELAAYEDSGYVLRPERAVDEAVLEAQRLLVDMRTRAPDLGYAPREADEIVSEAGRDAAEDWVRRAGQECSESNGVVERILSVVESPGSWCHRNYEVKVLSPEGSPLAKLPLARAP